MSSHIIECCPFNNLIFVNHNKMKKELESATLYEKYLFREVKASFSEIKNHIDETFCGYEETFSELCDGLFVGMKKSILDCENIVLQMKKDIESTQESLKKFA